MGAYTGLRKGDVLKFPWSARDGEEKRQGKIGEGLTFHGLRHTVATRLADAGASTRVIQSITGHATPQQVETYVATANKKRLAKRGIALIDQNKV